MATATALPVRTLFVHVVCNCPDTAPECCYFCADAFRCASTSPWYCSSGTSCLGITTATEAIRSARPYCHRRVRVSRMPGMTGWSVRCG